MPPVFLAVFRTPTQCCHETMPPCSGDRRQHGRAALGMHSQKGCRLAHRRAGGKLGDDNVIFGRPLTRPRSKQRSAQRFAVIAPTRAGRHSARMRA